MKNGHLRVLNDSDSAGRGRKRDKEGRGGRRDEKEGEIRKKDGRGEKSDVESEKNEKVVKKMKQSQKRYMVSSSLCPLLVSLIIAI